jgi:hypothetical protein
MKKLLFVPVALALVAPLSLYTNNLTSRANAQAPTTTSSTLSPVALLTKDWYHYTAKDGSYSALFPGKPEESVRSDSSVQVMYEDRANNRGYGTYNFKFPTNLNPIVVEENIEKVFDAFVAEMLDDYSVIDQKKINRQGLPGREITMRVLKGNKKGLVMKAQIFIDLKGSSMYLVMVGGENVDFPEAQAFLDSVSVAQK